MKIFGPLYDKVIGWSKHPYAERYLAGISFIESSFFPIPTAMMLAPMVMARRDRAWWLAFLATITSVLGGLFGYAIGFFAFEQLAQPIIDLYGKQDKFNQFQVWYDQYGVWIVALAGATVIPYKVVTVASGLFGLPLIPFILASLAGRAFQFFVIAAILKYGGAAIEPHLNKYIEIMGWALIVLAVVAYFVLT